MSCLRVLADGLLTVTTLPPIWRVGAATIDSHHHHNTYCIEPLSLHLTAVLLTRPLLVTRPRRSMARCLMHTPLAQRSLLDNAIHDMSTPCSVIVSMPSYPLFVNVKPRTIQTQQQIKLSHYIQHSHLAGGMMDELSILQTEISDLTKSYPSSRTQLMSWRNMLMGDTSPSNHVLEIVNSTLMKRTWRWTRLDSKYKSLAKIQRLIT